ncbi:hydroxymethylglutaryl-CoA lyase [Chromatiales bacterium (ex Bugula neritina AB1)]|nr:hydroxymethylglutaryl-CoA lyase [Chromatiales bacterium (ex Bugula neritina AB1)]
MRNNVEIIEVSPRDGIQNEKKLLSLETKLELIERAVDSGASRIEVTSFVNPRRVPQMAEADEICAALPRDTNCKYIGLALNRRGFERACNADLDEVNFVVVASDTFSQRNQGTDTETGTQLFNDLAAGVTRPIGVGVTIAAAFGCPFEGEMPLERLLKVVEGCMQAKPFELALADTIGVATPRDIHERIAAVRELYPDVPLRLHLHNTRNTGLANAWAGIEAGVSALDSSFGGVGGCPFAPAATGNIATEDLVYMLERAGISTGVNLEKAIDAAQFIETSLEKTVPGMVMKAGVFPQTNASAA